LEVYDSHRSLVSKEPRSQAIKQPATVRLLLLSWQHVQGGQASRGLPALAVPVSVGLFVRFELGARRDPKVERTEPSHTACAVEEERGAVKGKLRLCVTELAVHDRSEV